MRPVPVSERSARRLNVVSLTLTTSFTVFPSASPGALSGSFEVADTKVIVGDGSTESEAVTVVVTFTYLWFGGKSVLGDAVTEMLGAVTSGERRATSGSWSLAWSA